MRWTSIVGCALLAIVAPASGAMAATYRLTPESEVSYHVVHPLHQVKGVNRALEGSFALEGGRLVTPFTFKLPLLSFSSGNANRDGNAAYALGAVQFPLATLEVQRFHETGRTVADGVTRVTGTAEGLLTLRGVRRALSVPLSAALAQDRLTVDAAFEVRLSHHGIERPSLLFTPIRDEVRVNVHAVAVPR